MNNINLYRNIGISAHIDAGKTTTTERILYYSGVNYKIGEVHDGEATMDWMDQERERGITITSAATTIFWRKEDNITHRINIIDTPGHVDFTIEVERSMRVIDGACMIYCSVAGVQSQSETVWRQSKKYNIPKIIFVNKMDRVGSDFYKVYNQIKDVLKGKPLPIYIPYYVKDVFTGVIDLLKFKLILWDSASKGMKFNYTEIPHDYLDISNKWHDILIETVIENDDLLIEKYLNKENISIDEIIKIIRKNTINCSLQPMLCGSSIKNIGVQCLLNSILDFLPSPLDNPLIKGENLTGEITCREVSEKEAFSALAFKVVSDPFVGQLTYFRVYSGIINLGDLVLNSNKNKKERIGRILQIHANERSDIKFVGAGNICAITGLKDVSTGDTLCDIKTPIILEKISFPEPVIFQSIEVKNKTDQEKVSEVLNKIMKEDPSFKSYLDNDSNEIIISGMGELHLEVLIERIKREFNLNLLVGKPKVSYKETITSAIKNIEGKYIRQSGGRGQYGHVVISTEPNNKGSGFKFVNEIKGGVIPKEYIPIIENSIIETLKSGILAGFPVIDIIVYLTYGSYHEVDSSENAFKIAASLAIKDALKKSNPILLEPIMNVEVETSSLYMGSIISDISKRRGNLVSILDLSEDAKLIISTIPLSEMFGYSTSLRSLTQGRAVYSMSLIDYLEVPKNILSTLLKKI